MTREEAIKILKMNEQEKWRSGITAEEEKEAFDMAIEALKEKPHGKWIVSYECPNCGEIRNTPFEVCPQCKVEMKEGEEGDKNG